MTKTKMHLVFIVHKKRAEKVENAGRYEQRKRTANISVFLRERPSAIKEYHELLARPAD